MKPDAFAYENTEDVKNMMKKAAESKYLLPLIDRLLDTPITGMRQAFGLLSAEERAQWEKGLSFAGFKFQNAFHERYHYVFGGIYQSDSLAGD